MEAVRTQQQADGKREKRIGDVVDAAKLRCGRIPAGTGLVQESDRGLTGVVGKRCAVRRQAWVIWTGSRASCNRSGC